MNNTPTPRTDAEWQLKPLPDAKNLSKQLERELTAVTEQRDQWKEKYIQQNKDLGHELRDPNGTIWSECKRLQTELAAVTEQRDRLAEALANLVKANETWNQGMMDVIGRPPNWNDSYLNEAKEALQSLPPKP
jgi:septal ring factor EnvC (AmiA/AmiB activator)